MKSPSYRVAHAPAPPSGSSGTGIAFLAMRLVRFYGEAVPTVPQLQRDFGMSRATAHRWIRGFKEALCHE